MNTQLLKKYRQKWRIITRAKIYAKLKRCRDVRAHTKICNFYLDKIWQFGEYERQAFADGDIPAMLDWREAKNAMVDLYVNYLTYE